MSKHSEPVIGRRAVVLALTGAGLVAAVPESLVASAAAAPQRKTTSGKARYPRGFRRSSNLLSREPLSGKMRERQC